MTSPKGFLPWNPSPRPNCRDGVEAPSNVELLPQVLDVIERGRDHWPLTQRYWLYRLMALHGWQKNWEGFLNTILDRGRRAEIVPREAISAGRGTFDEPERYASANHIADNMRVAATRAHLDRQLGQGRQLALWIETEGMVPLVRGIAHQFSMPVLSGSGFDSLTRKLEFAEMAAALDKPLTILHVGDLDHSGDTIWRALIEDLEAMARHLGGELDIVRIAALDEHIDQFDLAFESVESGKADDGSNHGAHFAGTRSVQAESIDAVDLLGIIRANVESRLDLDRYRSTLNAERLAQDAALQQLGLRDVAAWRARLQALRA